jgi:hypothetical protein
MTDCSKGPASTKNLPNPKKSRSIVQAILKRSRDRDKFRYEFLATKYGYNYKQFRDSDKRSSIYDEQDPNWYSAGEFLNNQSNFRGQKTYGSTDSNKANGSSYCKWSRDSRGSRDSTRSTNQSVEDIIKLQPKRRQVVELQEFPIGYTQSYAGVDVNGKENELFAPNQDTKLHTCRHGNGHGPYAMSESNLDMYFSRMDKESQTSHSAEDGMRSGKERVKPRPTSPKSSAKIVQFYPTSFDYDTKYVQSEGTKSVRKDGNRDWHGEGSELEEEVSSDEMLSFDEEDELRIKHDFLYSPHMQGNRQCHHYQHDYPALLRYPDIPRHARPHYPKEYKTRMRRDVARSETELRRTSGIFGQQMPRNGHSRRGHHVSSSDTSLDRMQIENELAGAGLVKPKKKQPVMRVRDNRLEPLAGIMSPIRHLDNPIQKTGACENTAEEGYYNDETLSQYTMKKCSLEDQSYVVELPLLEPSCKEDNVDYTNTHESQEDVNVTIKGTKREQFESNYSRSPIEFNPHYIKNSYLRDEPVRDTDSDIDDAENTTSYLPSHCRVNTGNEGKPRRYIQTTFLLFQCL